MLMQLQEGPVPLDEKGEPFKYLQMAPEPVYRANAPSFDKVIFSAPSGKRPREGKGLRQPRSKKRISTSANPSASPSPDVQVYQLHRPYPIMN
jgi:hypothetical protein